MTAPVLLIHGNPGSARGWEDLRPRLQDRGVESFAYTQPGFGGQDWPQGGDFSLPAMASWLWRRLKEDTEQKVVLVGHSHGGSVALVMAGMEPQRVKGVCLLGSAGLEEGNYSWMRNPLLLQAIRLGAPLVDELELETTIAKMTAKNALGKIPRLIQPGLLTPVDGKTLEASFCAARDWKAGPIRRALARISSPITVMHGEEDKVVPPKEMKELMASLPNAKVVWIPNGGHSPHLDVPDRVVEEIRLLANSVTKKHAL